MSTNREHGRLTAKGPQAPNADDLAKQSEAPPTQSEAAPESAEDMTNELNSGEERAGRLTEDQPRLDPRVRAHLGRLVRTKYAALVEEPVPERFLKLLEELERLEKRN